MSKFLWHHLWLIPAWKIIILGETYWALYGEISSGSNTLILEMSTMKLIYQSLSGRNASCMTAYNYDSVVVVGGHSKTGFNNYGEILSGSQKTISYFSMQMSRLNPVCITIDSQRVFITGGFTEFWNRYQYKLCHSFIILQVCQGVGKKMLMDFKCFFLLLTFNVHLRSL